MDYDGNATDRLTARHIWFRYGRHAPHVLRDVSLSIRTGESVGLVGESGSGKTTFARILLGTLRPHKGEIQHPPLPPGARVAVAKVFQDVGGSIDPLFRVRRAIEEASGLKDRAARRVTTLELLDAVSLDPLLLERFPHELSGGQRQRVAIARALASGAKTLILDEPTSALDAHIRLQVVDLLNRLRYERSLSYLLISHDFQAISRLCSRVLVMLKGEIIEKGSVEEVLQRPNHAYTKELIVASTMERASEQDSALDESDSAEIRGSASSPRGQ